LVDRLTVRAAPRSPLRPVDPAEISVGVGPLVPNGHPILPQRVDIGFTAEKPEQLVDDRPQMDFFRGDQREPVPQVEACLRTEDAKSAGSSPVLARTPLLKDHFEEAVVFLHGRFFNAAAAGLAMTETPNRFAPHY